MSARQIIKSSDDIVRILRQGKRLGSPCVTIYIMKTPLQRDQSGRVAYIAGKKHGNAVWRNRSKRVLRAAWRNAAPSLAGYDVLLVATKATATQGSVATAQSIKDIVNRMGKML